jgi:flavin reductase (DIM6/NTAB) family NADH-FMN oxidoreductase RutF
MGKIILEENTSSIILPLVLLSTRNLSGKDNIMTVAWTGIINSVPPMLGIGIRKSRYSHTALIETGEFVINIPNENLMYAVDVCGASSGATVNKFEELKLDKEDALMVNSPLIAQSPINIECRIKKVSELNSHDFFMANILKIHVNERIIDNKGNIDYNKAKIILYGSHSYYSIGSLLKEIGYSKD